MTSNWKEYKLKDVCLQITDGVHNTVIDDPNGEYFLLSCKNIKNGNIIVGNQERRISLETLQKLRQRTKTQKDDVLLTSVGTIGETAIITDDEPRYEFQRSVAIFKPNKEKIVPRFLLYSLNNKKRLLQHSAEGAVQQCLFINPLNDFKILLPSLETQQKIAKVLSAIDDKIELNNSINNNLEQQAQAIFKSWYVDFEPFGGTMPEDWDIGKLEDVVEFVNGYAFKSSELLNSPNDDCYDVFKQGHIKREGGFNPSSTKSWYPKDKARTLEKYILKKGDVLMAMTDMKDNVAILGNTALMEIDDKYIVNQRVGLLRCKNNAGISYPYIYILTNSSDFLTDLRKRANSGVQVNLSSTEIKNSEIIIAPKEINQKFDNIVKPLFEQIFSNDIENQKLIQLRDTLLPKLMSGEIDVSNVEIDNILNNDSTDKLLFNED